MITILNSYSSNIQLYSGKSKSHSKKNNIIADAKTKFVKYLSPTYGGKVHDKKICDNEDYKFPEGSVLHKDSGYQVFNPEGVINFQPMKKPRKREISSIWWNRKTKKIKSYKLATH